MPKIIGLDAQNEALKKIKKILKDLETVNKFLESSYDSDEFTISFEKTASLAIASKEEMDRFVSAYKKRLADEVESLCKEFNIELDDDEKLSLGM